MGNKVRARWPVLIRRRATASPPAESSADDPDSFDAIVKRNPPVDWTFADFYREVTSPDSALHSFISGDIRDIACYLRQGRCLVMRVHIQNQRVPIVWLRAERRLRTNQGTILFSADRSKLQEAHDDYVIATQFTTLNFRHVINLLNNIKVPRFDRYDYSWWWAFINLGVLHQGFGGSWVKPTPPHWLEGSIPFSPSSAIHVESVERQFAIQFPNAKKISLRDLKRWTKEADSTLAGTKQNIPHIGSAPTLPEEHLQRPRPVQLPNANGEAPAATTGAEKHGGQPPRGREINRPNVLASKPAKSPTLHDLYRRSIPRTRKPLSGQTDLRRPVQPAISSSTPTPPKEASTGIDEATSVLQRVAITAPSAEALGQGLQSSPPFSNLQASPFETPNLTGRIVRLGSTPMARGGYSSVWRGTLLSATSDDSHRTLHVALKVLHASYTDESTVKRKLRKHLRIEMRIWAQLRHENVVRLLGHTEEPEGPGLVSISYVHGDVLSFLAKNPSVNREIICADVALGLQYLHEHEPPIVHGDLKGRNVLIDGEGRASICDFGLSIILDGGPTGQTSSNFGGSLRFLAPELLDESTRTVGTDIYAYACTCIQILFDKEPYHELSKEGHLIRAILGHRPPFGPSKEEVTFPSVLRILKRCWDHDRSSRPPLNLITNTIQRCLYRAYRTNLGVHQGIGRRVRFMSLPGLEQATLVSADDDGLSIIVDSGISLHRVPIYQRYRLELMDNQNLEDSEDDSGVSSSLSGKDASSSESPPHVSKWTDYSVKFRLPHSSMVSYESYQKASS